MSKCPLHNKECDASCVNEAKIDTCLRTILSSLDTVLNEYKIKIDNKRIFNQIQEGYTDELDNN